MGIIPYQKNADFVYKDEIVEPRPQLPILHETHQVKNEQLQTNIEFVRPEDIPLNKRNFIYHPCAANPLFTELGYSSTEYPFEKPGMNISDRSDNMSFSLNSNSTVSVHESLGWRTSKCDIFIKEGTCYWEVEVIKGGLPENIDINSSLQRKKDSLNSTPHLRVGISRREAALESPVGFDSYGYSVRDTSLESIHEGKISQVLNNTNSVKANDRLGFLLKLPTLESQIEQANEYIQKRIDLLIENSHQIDGIDGNNDESTINPSKKRTKLAPTNNDFERALLEDIDLRNVIRDKIPIRYKNQLFFESTDYVKTTKPEYYSADKKETKDYYTLKKSKLSIYLNGEYLGNAFEDLKQFLPPFSELQYNEKFYFGYWKNGEALEEKEQENITGNSGISKKKCLILRNKYVNNNQLGYYPTISCFNGGTAEIITRIEDLKYFDKIRTETQAPVKTLDVLYMEKIAEDIVWDIVDEIEEESNTNKLN